MDPRFAVSREELYTLQMDFKQMQLVQANQAERLSRLERRHEQDANLKSVWQSPFPGVLSGTPQQGPAHVSTNDLYDMDEQDHLLGSLHLGPSEEEPTRRGAASRANSVRFDESALRQSDWASQGSHHASEFGPPRPSSGMMMERSLSHKSDGRHSSAGHSVHSLHSLASGRASSLGMHTDNFSHEDESSVEIPEPPPEFFVLGPVPTIIRCWLTPQFAHHTIRYADLCTGSQKSVVDFALVKELDLLEEIQRDVDGVCRLKIPVYLVEATVSERNSRASSLGHHQIPSITATFEVLGMDQVDVAETNGPEIQIFIGNDTLRAHVADILLSQNRMSLFGNDREKLSVPFVRPENDSSFKHICTANIVPERPRLNANAIPFISSEGNATTTPAQEAGEQRQISMDQSDDVARRGDYQLVGSDGHRSKREPQALGPAGVEGKQDLADDTGRVGPSPKGDPASPAVMGPGDTGRRASSGGIWGPWRHGTSTAGSENGQRDGGFLSGYQPAGRGGRTMKVLKPTKASSATARTGTAHEAAPPSKASGVESRRKSQVNNAGSDSGSSNGVRWEGKRVTSGGLAGMSRDVRSNTVTTTASTGSATPSSGTMPRLANPVGGASAFSWMTPISKAKPATAAD